MVDKKYCIYKVVDKTNRKIYIGQTNDFEKRKAEHEKCYAKEDCLFHRALKKRGIENFEWSIIDYSKTRKELSEKEIYWIKHYNSYFRWENSKGYNMTKGGDGGNPWNTKTVMLFDLKANFIKEFNDCTECGNFIKNKPSNISRACRERTRVDKYLARYKNDYIKNGIKPYKRVINGEKPIIQLDIDGEFINEFKSLLKASKETKTSRTSISGCLGGYYKMANGFIWVYKKDYDKNKKYSLDENYGKKMNEIVQLTLDNKYIRQFYNCAEAAITLKVKSYKCIHKVLNKLDRSSYGYRWMSKENYLQLNQVNTEVTN